MVVSEGIRVLGNVFELEVCGMFGVLPRPADRDELERMRPYMPAWPFGKAVMFGDRGMLPPNDLSSSGDTVSLPTDNFLWPFLGPLMLDGRRVREVARDGVLESSPTRVVCGDKKLAASASNEPLQIASPRTCEWITS